MTATTSARATRCRLVNGTPITGPVRLNDGDVIEVSGVRMNFVFRE